MCDRVDMRRRMACEPYVTTKEVVYNNGVDDWTAVKLGDMTFRFNPNKVYGKETLELVLFTNQDIRVSFKVSRDLAG